jgi:hypothetical protein
MSINQETRTIVFEKHLSVIFGDKAVQHFRRELHTPLASTLKCFVTTWLHFSKSYPIKAYNGASYSDRVNYWFKVGKNGKNRHLTFLYVDEQDTIHIFKTVDTSNIEINSNNKTIKLVDVYKADFNGQFFTDCCIITTDISRVIPIFSTYTEDFDDFVSYIINSIGSLNNSKFNHKFTDSSDLAYNVTNNTSTIEYHNKGNKQMTKSNEFIKSMTTGASYGTSMLKGMTALAVAKSVLKPALRPVLRKMIEPKGKLTKMLSSNSVDEAVETMLESPLMDLMAAMVLSGIKVSGMVENEIFANVTQDATNTAFIKAAMLLDLDGIMSKVTSTVSELVTKVTDETKKAG